MAGQKCTCGFELRLHQLTGWYEASLLAYVDIHQQGLPFRVISRIIKYVNFWHMVGTHSRHSVSLCLLEFKVYYLCQMISLICWDTLQRLEVHRLPRLFFSSVFYDCLKVLVLSPKFHPVAFTLLVYTFLF